MQDQYFGIKELYEVVLRAKNPMRFGDRYLEADEPVLYFENITMSVLSEKDSPVMARGGWSNMPRVIWEDRSEVQFSLSEGVMSSISMGILLSANVTSTSQDEPLLVHKKEGPFEYLDNMSYVLDETDTNEEQRYVPKIHLLNEPVKANIKKSFIFEYNREKRKKKIYGRQSGKDIFLYEDKELTQPADINKKYIIDYYYEYTNEALIYTVQKERFNGLFTLEGKFYSKDENDGLDYTNLIYMPKVRVVSDINLRLGERADPSMSAFNIIGLPENVGGNKKSMILEITRLSEDIDSDI